MDDLNASYQRIIDVAAGRTLHPVSAFERRGTAIASVYQVGDVGSTPKAVSGRGTGSNVLIGYKAEAERLKLGLYGDNISVYVGAHTRASGEALLQNSARVRISPFPERV